MSDWTILVPVYVVLIAFTEGFAYRATRDRTFALWAGAFWPFAWLFVLGSWTCRKLSR